MGICGSTEKLNPEEERARKEEKIRSKWLDEGIEKEANKEKEFVKILFLGTGESGKSTLLKQMNIINNQGAYMDPEERKSFIPLVHNNIISSIKALAAHIEGEPDEKTRESIAFVESLKFDDQVTESVAAKIGALWKTPLIQAAFRKRSSFQLSDSTEYFFGRIDLVCKMDYLPDRNDILRARIRTTGIVEHKFVIEKNLFFMYDVGGQRSARKKWIHCFQDVTSVVFVVPSSAFDQVLYEDASTNCLVESLNLFDDLVNSNWFKSTDMILFLNKKDILKEKLQTAKVNQYFKEYTGDNSYRDVMIWLERCFKQRNRNDNKFIFVHCTNAVDTKNIDRVFNSVKGMILRSHLTQVGLLAAQADPDQDFMNPSRLAVDEDLQADRTLSLAQPKSLA